MLSYDLYSVAPRKIDQNAWQLNHVAEVSNTLLYLQGYQSVHRSHSYLNKAEHLDIKVMSATILRLESI